MLSETIASACLSFVIFSVALNFTTRLSCQAYQESQGLKLMTKALHTNRNQKMKIKGCERHLRVSVRGDNIQVLASQSSRFLKRGSYKKANLSLNRPQWWRARGHRHRSVLSSSRTRTLYDTFF